MLIEEVEDAGKAILVGPLLCSLVVLGIHRQRLGFSDSGQHDSVPIGD